MKADRAFWTGISVLRNSRKDTGPVFPISVKFEDGSVECLEASICLRPPSKSLTQILRRVAKFETLLEGESECGLMTS